jgi:hypothetical protein
LIYKPYAVKTGGYKRTRFEYKSDFIQHPIKIKLQLHFKVQICVWRLPPQENFGAKKIALLAPQNHGYPRYPLP